jgi:hypothetical protein
MPNPLTLKQGNVGHTFYATPLLSDSALHAHDVRHEQRWKSEA